MLIMENIFEIMLSGFLVASVSIIGIVILKIHPKIARGVERNLIPLSALSAGIFLVTSTNLIHETIEILPLKQAFLAFSIGIILYIILHKTLAPHRHQGSEHTHSHDEKKAVWKILFGDTLHNIADGLLLVASFGASYTIGIANAISIALHEVPQEISEFIVLKKSGYTNIEAIYRNFATALSIFIGITLGIFLVRTSILQAYLLGITATFFLGIVFTDLFPIRKLLRDKKIAHTSLALLLGVLIMVGITTATSHEHGHEDEHEQEHEHEDINLNTEQIF